MMRKYLLLATVATCMMSTNVMAESVSKEMNVSATVGHVPVITVTSDLDFGTVYVGDMSGLSEKIKLANFEGSSGYAECVSDTPCVSVSGASSGSFYLNTRVDVNSISVTNSVGDDNIEVRNIYLSCTTSSDYEGKTNNCNVKGDLYAKGTGTLSDTITISVSY